MQVIHYCSITTCIMMNESNHDLNADDDFMTPTKNVGLRITDDAMCELAKPNYVTNQFATHIGDDVDTKNTITFRASSNVLKFMLDVTNEYEKKAIRDMGFGSLIKFKIDMIPKALGRWLVDHFDANTCSLMYCNTKLEITGKFVQDILGVPNGKIKINLVSRASNKGEYTKMWKNQFGGEAIWYWSSEMLRKREKEDLESGGFALKPRLDLGKKKENHVRDTSTIGRMRYADEIRAETSIKVEKDVVECITTKVDSHKDANTSGIRKLEIMPRESNNEEFMSVLTSEFDKIVNMFVKIDGMMEKRLKICPGDPFIGNFMLRELFHEGKKCFLEMEKFAVVDILGQVGQLNEAYKLIRNMKL
ncbi:hypothetical protein Tco_1089103 [Tanacetum coccineum]